MVGSHFPSNEFWSNTCFVLELRGHVPVIMLQPLQFRIFPQLLFVEFRLMTEELKC